MAKILIVDDDTAVCKMFSTKIKSLKHEVEISNTLEDGLRKTHNNSYDVVLLDVKLPDGDGLSSIEEIRKTSSLPEVIIVTGHSGPDGAELAINNGAWDYIQKGTSLHSMILPLIRALEYREKKLSRGIPVALKTCGIIGNSPQMKDQLDLIAQAAASDANILITGETGTGKELVAKAIHENSSRVDKNFVVVDCAALPDSLVESMLLGHEKGAFTGADKSKKGLVEQAHEGTLFLDEIGELPYYLQKVFLRVLQERCFRPIGSTREVKSNFRLIAATNRDLNNMVRQGYFRKDLLYRLQTFLLNLIPLREHRQDIKDLTLHYIAKLCEAKSLETKGYSPEFLNILMSYSWQGNIRELINVLERAIIAAMYEPTLFPMHLPKYIRVEVARSSNITQHTTLQNRNESSVSSGSLSLFKEFRENIVAQAEKEYFEELMDITEGNIEKACRISGLKRTRLYSLLKKHSISKAR